MSTWTDRNGKDHKLHIHGQLAGKIKTATGIDLLACLKDPGAISEVMQRLQEPEIVMAVCATIENIADDEVEAYYEKWDGDAFESAGKALLEAIKDFFPRGPRAVLHRLLEKTITAQTRRTDLGISKALETLEAMDFDSVLSQSPTLGNGGTAFVQSSEPEQSISH